MERIKKFLADECGVTAIEYGLIAALIAVLVVVLAGGVALVLARVTGWPTLWAILAGSFLVLAAVAFAIFLFSLTGLPPFAGFAGKWYLFAALVERAIAGVQPGQVFIERAPDGVQDAGGQGRGH